MTGVLSLLGSATKGVGAFSEGISSNCEGSVLAAGLFLAATLAAMGTLGPVPLGLPLFLGSGEVSSSFFSTGGEEGSDEPATTGLFLRVMRRMTFFAGSPAVGRATSA
ncbi:MAG: hypothetical protein EOM68_04705 [Spirochaetia bacterium]|nr:hypothetical protein [Spirochaetia bacterium]